eukprot:XP_025002054.1 platelet glycoprotein VI-like [Gallus gallus]
MATFTLFGVTPADTSIYWCFYHIADTYLLPSALGGRVMLKVTWGPAPPVAEESHGNLVVVMLVPRPSLSLHPIQRVSLGDNVTLRCHLPRLASRIQLCQDQRLTSCMDKYEMQDVADFYITTKREHAGTYRCQYQVQKPLKTSEKSDPLELVLADVRYPPSSISIHRAPPVTVSI